MASSLRKLTGMGGDVRKIAALLQAKAPKGHKLAYINDEEAALLKSRGGSGKPHADTGIPSFEPIDIGFGPDQYTPTDSGPSAPSPSNEQILTDIGYTPQYTGGGISATPAAFTAAPSSGLGLQRTGTVGLQGDATEIQPAFSVPPSPKYAVDASKGLTEALSTTGAPAAKEGMSDETMKRLGLAGVLGVLGSRQAGKAASSGQAGAQQMQSLAAPYQQAGSQLQAQAQRGELTPAAQQSLQAMQAQAAQGATNRGGVGAQQAQAQVEAFRQQLLAQQYDYGLKLSGIGDNIALGAIKTGLQADQYVNQLTNQYYGNIARVAFGSAPQATATAGGTA